MVGVNYHGFFKDVSGIAEAARLNVLALQDAGVEISYHNYFVERRGIKKDEEHHEYNRHDTDFDINIFHVNLNSLTDFFDANPSDILNNKYNIAYWAWEFKEIPAEVEPYLSIFDEIWVPSSFCVEAFALVAPIPVLRFLHPISSDKPTQFSKEAVGIPSDTFNFLTIFDSISTTERKNPFGAITAFKKAFGANQNEIKLVVKTFNLERNESLFKELTETISNSPNIHLINENYDKPKMEALLQHCDALISLHRSEGFGLTMAEAMNHGKPVIGTGYSGNLDYMNVNNSLLVQYDYTTLSDDSGILKKGYIMADPDLNHAVDLMHSIVENKEFARKIGNRAKADIHSQLSIQNIGKQMKSRIILIQSHFVTSEDGADSQVYKNVLLENTVLREKVKYLENTLYSKIRRKINSIFKKK